MKILHITLKEV